MEAFKRKVGRNIRNARLDKGMTQKELGQKIGSRNTAISQYESGNRMPNLFVMSRLATALDMLIDDLVPFVACEEQVDPDQMTIELGD